MRSRRNTLIAVLLCGLAPAVHAQSNSGALDLLFPIGARGTALGSAYVAETGSESIWWNPAGLARVTTPEFALDHFSNFQVDGGDAISLVLPAGPVGTFGIAARLFNFGSTPTTSGSGDEIGLTSFRSYIVGGSFAATFGERTSAGLSFRVYDLSAPCTGGCGPTESVSSPTATLDAGVQFRSSATSPWTVGLLVSNVGPELQVHDKAQADGLPARVHAGVSIAPSVTSWDPALRLRASAELVATPALSSGELRVGGEAGYQSLETTLFVRGGYAFQSNQSQSNGPTVGFGIATKRVRLDVARIIESFSTDQGKPPTYISIRVGL